MTCYGVGKSVTVLIRVLRVASVTVLTCGVLPVGIICCKTFVSVANHCLKILIMSITECMVAARTDYLGHRHFWLTRSMHRMYIEHCV